MRNNLLHSLRKFFTIDNPLLFVTFLCIIVFNRFVITFFNDGYHIITPDNYYYAGVTVGGDWVNATTNQAYRLLQGLPMQLQVGYGYSFTIFTSWSISILNSLHVCDIHNHIFCQFLLYKVFVTCSVVGFFILIFFLTKNTKIRTGAILFFITFLLGIPGGRGIEAGNLDIILSVLYGIMLYVQKLSLQRKRRIYPIFLGIIAGILLQTKLFILPVALLFLIFSTEPILFFISFLLTVTVVAIIPIFYGVSINPFQVIQAGQAVLSPITKDLYIKYTYGNNNTRAMVGAVVFSIGFLHKNAFLRQALIFIGGILLFVTILLLPIVSLLSAIYRKLLQISFRDRWSYSLFVMLNCYAIAAIILWPGMSYDYRFFYLLPLIFILLDSVKTNQQKIFLGFALLFLTIRSIFILHTKIWHIFLLLHFYFFLFVSLSLWIQEKKRDNKMLQ